MCDETFEFVEEIESILWHYDKLKNVGFQYTDAWYLDSIKKELWEAIEKVRGSKK